MRNKLSFGEFVMSKRQSLGLTIREFSKKLSVSAAFVCGMESGKKPAPSVETQMKIAKILELTETETELLVDLAVRTKREGTIPGDVCKYILMDSDVIVFLRKAKRLHAKGKDLLKLL